ncbi:protein SSUH2 homolog isoform X1 [Osmerus eperlanus]|uniref:protein SSUH2 homolog isoform X1 n=1 Tax=Osmerus eperlanus TaxID=29151 RepID=UPI002E0F699C
MLNPPEGQALYAPPVAATGPTAPPASMFGTVPGYEGTLAGGGGGYLPPPMPVDPTPPPQPTPVGDWNIPAMTEDQARQAFKTFASAHCCYSGGPANDGVITNMESLNTYRYRLETYTESRSTEWAHKAHEGEPADFYTQTAPRPWEVQVTPPAMFTNKIENVRVPFTSSIKDCHTCHASGTERCEDCHGDGTKQCWVCKGSGQRLEESCSQCSGRGTENCRDCSGKGTIKCVTCEGKRQLLTYINLKVEWKTNVEDFAQQLSGGLQVDLANVHGKELFKNAQYMVYPAQGFPDPAISQASERIVREHQAKYSQDSRILQQQQTIELIPITKVNYKWKNNSHHYVVYGNEMEVSSDYPATCCCTIM